MSMKAFCCIVVIAGSLISLPAMAQQGYGNGGGTTNIWSGAQGSSNSSGNASGYGTSSSGSAALGGGRSSLGAGTVGGGVISSVTSSYAAASTSGNGYVQVQTSGYAGGTVSGFAGRSH
jgi:hypothetical protein